MQTFPCLIVVRHEGKRYNPGDSIKLDDQDVIDGLTDLRAIGEAVEDEPEKAPAKKAAAKKSSDKKAAPAKKADAKSSGDTKAPAKGEAK